MTTPLKRVFALGLASHVMLFSTLFTIVCGLFPNGTDYMFSFFFTAVVVAVVVYVSSRQPAGLKVRPLVIGSTTVLLLGIAVLCVVAGARLGKGLVIGMAICFAIVGFFLLRRVVMMVIDLKYVRDALLGQFKVDVITSGVLSFVVVFFSGWDSRWETKMMPLFTAFLLTRMMALSLASQMDKEQNMRKSMIEQFQRRMPFLVVVAGLLSIWILSVIGGPIWSAVVNGFVYVLEAIAEFIAAHFNTPEWLKELLQKIGKNYAEYSAKGNNSSQKSEVIKVPVQPTRNWLWLEILLIVVVVAGAVWYLYRLVKRLTAVKVIGDEVEIREFLHSEKPSKKRAKSRWNGEAPTQMRKIYRKFLLGLQGRSFVRHPGETPKELVAKVGAAHPEWRATMNELTEYYMRERYGGQSVEQELPRAEELAKEVSEHKGERNGGKKK